MIAYAYNCRAMRTVTATRYVTPLREGGSLPAIVEADHDSLVGALHRTLVRGGVIEGATR